MFLSETMRAIVILACEKHSDPLTEKIRATKAGNWVVLPTLSLFKTGYWPNVSDSHEGAGSVIVGFIEAMALSQELQAFETQNYDNGLCPQCAIYEWNISSLHTSRMTRDPVCHRLVASDASLSQMYHDRLFFFCSMGCRDRFHNSPREFVPSAPEVQYSLPTQRR
jgi:YHS domain-containing protein